MPVEKPLFRPDALRPLLKSFRVPDEVAARRDIVQRWAKLLASQQGGKLGEQQLLADFISDIFGKILGYQRPADNAARYTQQREQFVKANGKFADAVLGEFVEGQPDRPVVAVEGKGPNDPLDRTHAGRSKSAVDQCYDYAINLQCDWIIVTSMKQTRLYHKGSDKQTFERFDIADLASSDAAFKKFVYLLAAQRVVPLEGECHFVSLKAASEKIGRELTKEFYLKYADIRQDVFEAICEFNPQQPRRQVLSATQRSGRDETLPANHRRSLRSRQPPGAKCGAFYAGNGRQTAAGY